MKQQFHWELGAFRKECSGPSGPWVPIFPTTWGSLETTPLELVEISVLQRVLEKTSPPTTARELHGPGRSVWAAQVPQCGD